MRYPLLVRVCAAAALTVSIPAAAAAKPWNEGLQSDLREKTQSTALKWEVGYLALSAIDAGETIGCLNRHVCEEGNPIFGKHPSVKTLVLGKIGLGAIHFLAFSALNHQNPKAALRVAQVSCAVQGGVAMLNARFSFN